MVRREGCDHERSGDEQKLRAVAVRWRARSHDQRAPTRPPTPAADEEHAERRQRCPDGDAAGSGDAEAEDDVAGHVRDEDVAELQVAGRVDESGDHGQRQQQRREWTVRTVRTRPERRRDFPPGSVHGAHRRTGLPGVRRCVPEACVCRCSRRWLSQLC